MGRRATLTSDGYPGLGRTVTASPDTVPSGEDPDRTTHVVAAKTGSPDRIGQPRLVPRAAHRGHPRRRPRRAVERPHPRAAHVPAPSGTECHQEDVLRGLGLAPGRRTNSAAHQPRPPRATHGPRHRTRRRGRRDHGVHARPVLGRTGGHRPHSRCRVQARRRVRVTGGREVREPALGNGLSHGRHRVRQHIRPPETTPQWMSDPESPRGGPILQDARRTIWESRHRGSRGLASTARSC